MMVGRKERTGTQAMRINRDFGVCVSWKSALHTRSQTGNLFKLDPLNISILPPFSKHNSPFRRRSTLDLCGGCVHIRPRAFNFCRCHQPQPILLLSVLSACCTPCTWNVSLENMLQALVIPSSLGRSLFKFWTCGKLLRRKSVPKDDGHSRRFEATPATLYSPKFHQNGPNLGFHCAF